MVPSFVRHGRRPPRRWARALKFRCKRPRRANPRVGHLSPRPPPWGVRMRRTRRGRFRPTRPALGLHTRRRVLELSFWRTSPLARNSPRLLRVSPPSVFRWHPVTVRRRRRRIRRRVLSCRAMRRQAPRLRLPWSGAERARGSRTGCTLLLALPVQATRAASSVRTRPSPNPTALACREAVPRRLAHRGGRGVPSEARAGATQSTSQRGGSSARSHGKQPPSRQRPAALLERRKPTANSAGP
mmetsp:Transcript_34010/g.80731  ORF Transcript_34010/g.80731 Transcript_34010/m.80731 type:complete len:242 (+) Transcript_34010:525-1250(+)